MAAKLGGKARRRHGPHPTEYRKGRYKRQVAITERNRQRKRQKHVSLHPNDIAALAKLKELL